MFDKIPLPSSNPKKLLVEVLTYRSLSLVAPSSSFKIPSKSDLFNTNLPVPAFSLILLVQILSYSYLPSAFLTSKLYFVLSLIVKSFV